MWWVLLNLQLQRPHFVFLILYSGVVICRTQINIITSTVNSFYFSLYSYYIFSFILNTCLIVNDHSVQPLQQFHRLDSSELAGNWIESK